MKIMPKLKFRIAKLNEVMPEIHWFLNPQHGTWDWSNSLHTAYPDLKDALADLKGNKKKKAEYQYFKDFVKRESPVFKATEQHFQAEWNKIGNRLLSSLSQVVEQPWAKRDRNMLARISPNPICPRYIEKREFDVFYRFDSRRMIRTALHEILHFIYFDKWKAVFPKVKTEEFNYPYLVWHLSEMAPCAVLNDKRIQKIIPHTPPIYSIYEKYKVGNIALRACLQKMYDGRKDFADFLIKLNNFGQKHKQEILNLK